VLQVRRPHCLALARPPDAALRCAAPEQARGQGSLTYEERLEAAERRRADGNEAFRTGKYDEALGKYR
jgi:hypothetical protein